MKTVDEIKAISKSIVSSQADEEAALADAIKWIEAYREVAEKTYMEYCISQGAFVPSGEVDAAARHLMEEKK